MSTWYLGRLGDLRPLVCPERDITINEVRYGGVHQGLSGARIMDVTGHRSDYTFEFKHLDQEEFSWLENLHTRLVPGPHLMINPLKRNRLTLQASTLVVSPYAKSGVRGPIGSDYGLSGGSPSGLGVPSRSVYFWQWTDVAPRITFDGGKYVPVLPGEKITASVWLATEAGQTYNGVTLRLDWFDSGGEPVTPATDSSAINLTGGWMRYSLANATPPTDAVACRFSIGLPAGTPKAVFVAGPQVEAATTPSSFEVGCAAPEVLIDQLETTSPRYPLRDATLTILEA